MPTEPIQPTEQPSEPQNSPTEAVPVQEAPKYLWDTVEHARHSVRVICDEEGLTSSHIAHPDIRDKDSLCATVGGESGWQSYWLAGPLKGQPVKRTNYRGGVLWSTDWGICQINDWWNIKDPSMSPTEQAERPFDSVEHVLNDPEADIRWMCGMWKAGCADYWIAHKNGSFRHFL